MPSANFLADTADLRRRFTRLTWTNILANITVPLAGLIDTAMLGHLSSIRFLAGVALASILFDYVYWTFGFLRMGTTGLTAQAVGRRATSEVYGTLYRAALTALGIGLLLLATQIPLRELGFSVLHGSPEVMSAARDYFSARIWAAPAALLNFAFIGWFLGREQARTVLLMTIIANVTNIAFNWLFIMRLGWAARGAGLATAVSQYAMLAVALVVILRARRMARPEPDAFRRGRWLELLRINLDIVVRTLCLVTVFAVFTNLSSVLGVVALAANTLTLRILTLAAYAVDGAAFAAESLAGHCLGRRDLAGLRYVIRLSLGGGLAFAVLLLLLTFIAPELWLGLLTSHKEVVDHALRYLPWLVPTLLTGSLAYMYDGIFLGITEVRRLRNAMLVSAALFIPLALAGWQLGSNHLLWAGLALFHIARPLTLRLQLQKIVKELARRSPASPLRSDPT